MVLHIEWNFHLWALLGNRGINFWQGWRTYRPRSAQFRYCSQRSLSMISQRQEPQDGVVTFRDMPEPVGGPL